jgi:hypothetical protein
MSVPRESRTAGAASCRGDARITKQERETSSRRICIICREPAVAVGDVAIPLCRAHLTELVHAAEDQAADRLEGYLEGKYGKGPRPAPTLDRAWRN